jgi:glutathione S-transferase
MAYSGQTRREKRRLQGTGEYRMSGLKIYGATQSRAFRALWAAKELGIDYEHVKDISHPDFVKVNPNAKMPALSDGNTHIFESMAINLYLARKYDKGLWPKSVEDEGVTFQWSFWVMTEVEKPLLNVLMDVLGMKKDAKAADEGRAALEKPFNILNMALAGKDYLLGNEFTIADLNVASVINWAKPAKIDLAQWPNLKAWLDRCTSRPAAIEARK